MIEQKEVNIGEVKIFAIYDNNEVWYPVKKLCKEILNINSLCSLVDQRGIYNKLFKLYKMRYTPKQPMKETWCISGSGLIEVLVKTNVNKLSIKHIEDRNKLHKYLGIHLIHISEEIISNNKLRDVDKSKKMFKRKINRNNSKLSKEKRREEEIEINKKKIISYILKRHYKKMPLSSSAIQKQSRSFHDRAIRYFGSWENAIIESGLDYNEIREDVDKMQYYGLKFEALLKDILVEIHGHISKGYNQHVRPDFIIEEDSWIDAKLSSWTQSTDETIRKYEYYCEHLTIIYLRGNRKTDKRITKKTRIISVYKYIKILPSDRQNYYIPMLDELYKKATDQEVKINKEKKKIKKNDLVL